MEGRSPRPSVFIGSSSEGLPIAKATQVELDPIAEVELWTQGVFGLGQGTLESLVLALQRFDFAMLVLTADDMVIRRGNEAPVARDNVLFELGLFVGALGRDRTFMVYDRTDPPTLPSDLAGVTGATFAPHASGNIRAALGAPCTKIQIPPDNPSPRKPTTSTISETARFRRFGFWRTSSSTTERTISKVDLNRQEVRIFRDPSGSQYRTFSTASGHTSFSFVLLPHVALRVKEIFS